MKLYPSEVIATFVLVSAVILLCQYEHIAHYPYLDAFETIRLQSLGREECIKTLGLDDSSLLAQTVDPHPVIGEVHKIQTVNSSEVFHFQQILSTFHPSIIRDFNPWLSRRINRPTDRRCQLILIRNNTGISYMVSESLPRSLYNKARALDTQMRWVAARLHPGKVVTMCFHLGSTPLQLATSEPDFPVYSLAKSDHHLDILYPNMYFGFGGSLDHWGDFQKQLAQDLTKTNYSSRENRAFWRGTCGGYKYNLPRIHLVLAGKNLSALDVGFSNKCPARDHTNRGKDDQEAALLLEEVNSLPTAKFIRPTDMTKYKYLFSMPGSSKGSYSRHMQTALCSNATVFLWDNIYYEFYYSLLKPWVHFIPVSEATLRERVKWVIEHEQEAEAIAANGYQLCMTYLTPSAFPVYWFQLFTMHSLLQRYDVTMEELSGACTCGSHNVGQPICNFC